MEYSSKIVVTGEIVARADSIEEALRLSLEHVHRSRAEPGCISHSIYVDPENARRMFFFEEWKDEAALRAHFAVPASRQFVRDLKALLEATTGARIFRSEPLTM